MRRLLILLIVLSLCIYYIVVALSDAPTMPSMDFTGEPTCQVTRVLDGDTLEILMDGKATTVRLIGVATPETIHPGKPVEYYGPEASTFLTNLLKGEEVYVRREAEEDSVDRWERPLVYLYRSPDGLFVNLEIIRQGYGHVYEGAPCRYLELFRYYEGRAKEVNKGLHQLQPPSEGVIVWRTQYGKKYHTEKCPALRSKIQVTVTEAKERGLGPCSKCSPPE